MEEELGPQFVGIDDVISCEIKTFEKDCMSWQTFIQCNSEKHGSLSNALAQSFEISKG